MESKTTIIVFSIASILAIGLISGPAYASFTNFQQNFVHISWNDFDFQSAGDQEPLTFEFDEETALNLYTTGQFESSLACTGEFLCTFDVVNFVDELQIKLMLIDITYQPNKGVGPNKSVTPTISTTCFDATNGTSTGIQVIGLVDPDDPDKFFFDIVCRANPDWERLVIQLNENVTLVEIWTETFDDPPIGGTFIPLDTTALLLAGAQSISMWMIPVVVAGIGIGIGVFVIKRRE